MRTGILVAKAILTGDMDRAHRVAGSRYSWSVSEARAIVGACRVARSKFNCEVYFTDFL